MTLRRSSWSSVMNVVCLMLLTGLISTANAADWYVKATAADGGDGSKDYPFDSLGLASAASSEGDTIYILHTPASKMLDGRIRLKPGQKLIGTGPDVRNVSENAAGARILYTGGGAVVWLSTDNEIANIHFKGFRTAIFGATFDRYGDDYGGANIHDNLFTGSGVKVGGGSHFAVDLLSLTGHSEATVKDNVFRDGVQLAGIRIQNKRDSSSEYTFEGNHFDNIGFRAYGFWTSNNASLQAEILNSSANNIGAQEGELSKTANAPGILMQLHHSSTQDVVVDGYTYDNTDQVGGPLSSGLTLFFAGEGFNHPSIWADHAEATLKINNSSFSNAATEAVLLVNFGSNSTMDVEIENSIIIDADPRAVGADFGMFASAVSVFPALAGTGNMNSLKLENCDIIGSTGYGLGVYDGGAPGYNSVIDLGGGALGSIGGNRILDNARGAIGLFQTTGVGRFNWWGENAPQIDLRAGSTFFYDPALSADPLD
jgi:hypothetical protein